MNGETVREHDMRANDGVDAYTVPCPLCEAKVGELCSSSVDGPRNASPHNARLAVARAELESGATS